LCFQDYDFETANEEFKEKLDVVTDELAEKVNLNGNFKLKISCQISNLVEHEEPNSADENEEREPADNCYDKKSSFFDSISCEALEKAEG
jgi:hypothetical protein